MHKHLQNLERLCEKMQARYGEQDELVAQLQQALTSLRAKSEQSLAARNQGRRKQDVSLPGEPSSAATLH
jgi:ABC-type transporter Mla subunit MlaD